MGLVVCWNATDRPSGVISGQAPQLGHGLLIRRYRGRPASTLASVVTPETMFRTNTSGRLLVSADEVSGGAEEGHKPAVRRHRGFARNCVPRQPIGVGTHQQRFTRVHVSDRKRQALLVSPTTRLFAELSKSTYWPFVEIASGRESPFPPFPVHISALTVR